MRSFILSTFLIVNAAGRIGIKEVGTTTTTPTTGKNLKEGVEVQPKRKMSVAILDTLSVTLCAGVSMLLPPGINNLAHGACTVVGQSLNPFIHDLIELLNRMIVAEVLNILQREGVINEDIARKGNEIAASGEITAKIEQLAPAAIGVSEKIIDELDNAKARGETVDPLHAGIKVAGNVIQSPEAQNLAGQAAHDAGNLVQGAIGNVIGSLFPQNNRH